MASKTFTRRIALKGNALLTHPRFNKGTAFNPKERKEFALTGHLPHRVNTLDEQCNRAYNQLSSRESPIAKNTFLQSLKEQNWVLYYQLLSRHLDELVPIIYTPTEAEAISNYSHLFRRSEGLYLTFPDQDTMEEDFLEQTKGRHMDLVVCSDAEAILGIGDQGVGGIGVCDISAAKSVIYTLVGGIDPSRTLPVMLDVGTDNEDLLNDELYVGWPQKRVRGEEYDKFIDKFVQLVRKYFPTSLLHFEDFGVTNAHRILERYADQHSVFNDDIQGTGAVTLATVISAVKVTKTKLSDQRIIVYGAGSAGLGIARQLRDAMAVGNEVDSSLPDISTQESNTKFYLIDKFGLLTTKLKDQGKVRDDLDEFVRQDWNDENDGVHLVDVVRKVKPTILIGCSTHAGGFTEDVVKAMKDGVERPIILPLSNPSKLVEAHPEDIWKWSDGKALIATGSPFGTVGDGYVYVVGECNNALIYPGLGLGSIISHSKKMTLQMITAGARRLAELSPALKGDSHASLLPAFENAPEAKVAIAVVLQAIKDGVAGDHWDSSKGEKEVRAAIEEMIWKPVYSEFVYDEAGEK
ncbi:hypothetical protein DL96DRAFT_1454568 [Flagelloscypha sp. PMI_526]|nr:hypothetical protein DL96DRAFT_1454568 [Flagelloscypha sp. PMI_526]